MLSITRWDNGETEKLSPWDVEPIPDNGNEDFLLILLLLHPHIDTVLRIYWQKRVLIHI